VIDHQTFLSPNYSTHSWTQWHNNQQLWHKTTHQRELLDSAAHQLGVKQSEEWYNITLKHCAGSDVGSLLQTEFNNSPLQMLQSVYPEHKWLQWKFAYVPGGFWQEFKNQRLFAEWMAQQLGIIEHEDWYAVARKDVFDELGASGLLQAYFDCSTS